MKKHYDYLVVGCGLFGVTFAEQVTKKGKSVLIIEKRDHVGGNVYTEEIEKIHVHKYGAHIFHTSYDNVWEYVQQFASFNNFVNEVIAVYKNKRYHLPFNMNTFQELWGSKTEEEAKTIINQQIKAAGISTVSNLEEQAISLVGTDVYEKLIKGYTEKQWGKECKDLPPSIIKRLPIRYTYDNNYFNDKYQGIPIGGYTKMINNMLKNVDVLLSTNYFEFIKKFPTIADKTIYTGPIDEFFNFKFGKLEYRTVRFENELLETDDFQHNAVINYTEKEIPYTRIIEHKYFDFQNQPKTFISREYPVNFQNGMEPYYPINDDRNENLYRAYEELAKSNPNIVFKGRLGEYKYYDMDDVIYSALEFAKNELS